MKLSVVTNDGRKYFQNAIQNSQPIRLSKVVFGDGTVETRDEALKLSSVKSQKKTIGIEQITRDGSDIVLSIILNNVGTTVGYNARELGIYAKNQDNTDTMIMYTNYDTESSFVQSENKGLIRIDIEIRLTVGETVVEVTNETPTNFYVTKEYLDAELAKKIGKVTDNFESNTLWAKGDIYIGPNKEVTLRFNSITNQLDILYKE